MASVNRQASTKRAKRNKNEPPPSPPARVEQRRYSWFRMLVVVLLTMIFGVLQRNHVARMFEEDRHFSHLSDMEREMTFRTEMGLYYSYYKTVTNAPSFRDGLTAITVDNITEYGHTINTLKRFNLYPEVVLAWAFRNYVNFAEWLNYKPVECWHTNRGAGMGQVVSCEGMGNQPYFYVNSVFALSSVVAGSIFLFGVLISDSILGGLIAVSAFFFNHGEATRVQWTPPLRESFGYPIFILQMLVVSLIIKKSSHGIRWSAVVCLLTSSFMMVWQFASFALSTQVGSLFVVSTFGYIPMRTFRSIINGLLAGFIVAFVFLFGNEMLLTSLFLSSLLTLQLIFAFDGVLNRVSFKAANWTLKIILFAVGTIGIKMLLSYLLDIKDDAHVFDLLRAKFTDYSDFHTRLYTCAVEFDFIQSETIWKLCKSLLLPAGIASTIGACILLFKIEFGTLSRERLNGDYGSLFYNVIQAGAFTVMAILIMRLKLFFTPHLCILASSLASRRIWDRITNGRLRSLHQTAFCGLVIALMAYEGFSNLQHQWSINGEYSNYELERFFKWISQNTPNDAVFGGSMPTMANLKLATERPIVNHPHYEDAGLRERTMNVYSIYSRKPAEEVHKILHKMSVNYVVFEYGWCMKGGKPGCSLPELWDLSDRENRGKTALCEHFRKGNYKPFKLAFQTENYKLLSV